MAPGNPNVVPIGARATTRSSGGESQGGGFRGGPKRWTGKGPAPARHIPWPEIFKHHISVIEGHLKMVDMVRKHTVEGSGNWRTITDVCNRAQEMLKTSRQISYSFVPPPNQRDQVPLGVSSDSMYPGYSPADHEYGKAAEEYGRAVAEAKRRGVEIPKHPDIDYQVGQARGTTRKPTAKGRESSALKGQQIGSGSGSGSGSGEGSAEEGPAKKQMGNGHVKPVEKDASTAAGEAPEGENPFFVIDTEPTPVSIPGHISKLSPTKREADAEPPTEKKSKKPKKTHEGGLPAAPAEAEETVDISAEVEARMKEKEEKRKRKDQKKRKRESDKSDVAAAAEIDTAAAEGAKPKKKKKKMRDAEAGEELADRAKRAGEEGEEVGKKKRKKSKS